MTDANRATDAAPAPGRGYVVYALVLFLFVNVFNFMDRMLLAVLLEPIRRELGLSDTQLGLLGGLAFALTYAVAGIPIARWADRGCRRSIVALSLSAWSVMTAACGLAQNYWHLLAARFGVGIGEAGATPPIHSMITDLFAPHRRSTAMAIFTSGAAIGAAVGMSAAGWLSDQYGWRWAFAVLGPPGLALALVIRFTLREPARSYSLAAAAGETGPSSGIALALWSIVPLRLVIAGGAALAFVSYGVNQWAPTYFMRQFSMSSAQVGAAIGLAYGVGSALGLLAGGFFADRLARRDAGGPMRVIVAASLGGAPLYWLAFGSDRPEVAIALLFAASAVSAAATAPLMAVAQQFAPPQARATVSALLMFAISVVGLGGAAWFIGAASDALHPRFGVVSLRYAIQLAVASLLVAAVLFSACLRSQRG